MSIYHSDNIINCSENSSDSESLTEDNIICNKCDNENYTIDNWNYDDCYKDNHEIHNNDEIYDNNDKCGSLTDRIYINDEYLLNYLLSKYKIDKSKLINSIIKSYNNENKKKLVDDFYCKYPDLLTSIKTVKQQYKIFKKWNTTNIFVDINDFDDFYYTKK